MNRDEARRAAWAARLREHRAGHRESAERRGPDSRPQFRYGYPRAWWNSIERDNPEDERWDYEYHTRAFMEGFDRALDGPGETRKWGAADGFQAGLDWMEEAYKTRRSMEWPLFQRKLVEGEQPIGRGRQGPFYPRPWWYTETREPYPNNQPVRRQTVPDEKLPPHLNDRIVMLTLTHIRGAMLRWKIRRDLGRSDESFMVDCDYELGSVWSCVIPWQGAWRYVTVNGREQEGHGYSKQFQIRVSPDDAMNWDGTTKIKQKQILQVARRVFRVPTLYAAGVDETTGQAAFF